ncbi:MAG TPA: toxic anion resistance protein [Candidatus Limnocylindrales bacterium]|nr:toxic anion resistance protein [Candidatus Limnocylindrales bacterium]
MAAGFVDAIVAADAHGDVYRRLLADVGEIGEREIVATSELSHRLVDRPMRAIIGTLDGESPIARSLAELREAVEELDPGRLGRSGGRQRRLLGVIPLGDPVDDALERYTKARVRIQRILGSLAVARTGLQAEIAAIGQEQRALATEIETLRQYADLARALDERLDERLATLASSEPQRAEALRTDVQFAIRQRRRDLLIQLAVATQGDAALRVVQDNNQQVVRTIRMATTTTAAALRTSVAVAQAMADQRRILAQLATVREVDRTVPRDAEAPRVPSSPDVARRAAVGVDLAGLKRAWDTVFATLDQFDSYSVTAIDAMREAVEELAEEAERSRAALEADRALGGSSLLPPP